MKPKTKFFTIRGAWYQVDPDGRGAYAKTYAVVCKESRKVLGNVTRTQKAGEVWYCHGDAHFHDLKEAVECLVVATLAEAE